MQTSQRQALQDLAVWTMSQPALLDCLGQHFESDSFRDVTLAAAKEQGIAIDSAMIDQLLHPDPLGLARFRPRLLNGGPWPAPGWLPARSVSGVDEPAFDWAWFGMGGLDKPFFDDNLRSAGALPLSRVLGGRHSLSELCAAAPQDLAQPAGFIFHLSRCGSTLLGRLLAAWPGHACLSEPEPLDAVVQWAAVQPVGDDGKPPREAVRALQVMVAALMHNLASGTRAFFKLDCWHVAALPLFRAAFPHVPWLFLYRDPVEVAVSQLEMPGMHVVPGMPGASLMGLSGGEELAREDYCAMVLGAICRAALSFADVPGGMLLHYDEIFASMDGRLPRHFGFGSDPIARQRVTEMQTIDAKHPERSFVSDSASKQAQASESLRASVQAYAGDSFRALEIIRKVQ